VQKSELQANFLSVSAFTWLIPFRSVASESRRARPHPSSTVETLMPDVTQGSLLVIRRFEEGWQTLQGAEEERKFIENSGGT
jgi:hypothetical protein